MRCTMATPAAATLVATELDNLETLAAAATVEVLAATLAAIMPHIVPQAVALNMKSYAWKASRSMATMMRMRMRTRRRMMMKRRKMKSLIWSKKKRRLLKKWSRTMHPHPSGVTRRRTNDAADVRQQLLLLQRHHHHCRRNSWQQQHQQLAAATTTASMARHKRSDCV